MRRLVALIAVLAPVLPATAACIAQSGERTVALVELYTAGRCAGCAGAEEWLAELARRPRDAVLPVATYVDYAAYLGGKGSNIEPRRAQREQKLLLRQRTALVYTPQVLVQGREFRAWQSAGFAAELDRIHAQPARARLTLELRSAVPNRLAVRLAGRVLDAAQRPDARVYVAAVQSRAAGAPLRVLEWQGPFGAASDGRFAEERSLPLLPEATPAASGVAAFVQNRRTSEVLQAIVLAACRP